MYSKIINPKTGRKVSVKGRLGQIILRNYMKELSGKFSKGGAQTNIISGASRTRRAARMAAARLAAEAAEAADTNSGSGGAETKGGD
uniref:Uncharacterized protein n=1 Tax=viral metagenome TaxID=1070528 RepID=A0A6C0B5D0_9ZZZZ